jgi:proline dehydrogenase
MFARTLILRTAALRPIEGTVKRSRFFRPLVSRFIAGNDLEEALAACNKLIDRQLMVTLDYLGENTHSEAEASVATDTFVKMLHKLSTVEVVRRFVGEGGHNGPQSPTDPAIEPLNISIKLSQCGLDLGDEVAVRNYRNVLEVARESDNFVRVDMEGSDYTQRTLDLVLRAHEEFPQTGTVLQSYLFRNDEDVALVIERKLRVRLVKGAYLEPSDIAYADKTKVDEAFVRQAKQLLKHGFYPAIATHDAEIIAELKKFANEENIAPHTYEFQMLYGIRRDLQEQLQAEGYRVRIYVPFGDQWYPYFTRRLAERPANALFILRSLLKG